ncbi:MAG: hypothetical protein ABJE66_04320 [Deltaproteobacteria bacterium]
MDEKRAPIPRAIARDDKPSPIDARRRRGVVLIVAGLVAGAALFVALIVLRRIGVIEPRTTEYVRRGVTVRESTYSGVWGIPVLPPLFTTLIGAIQLLTGRSLRDLAKAYETMSAGRRFVVSVLVVALALALIGSLVAIAFAIIL